MSGLFGDGGEEDFESSISADESFHGDEISLHGGDAHGGGSHHGAPHHVRVPSSSGALRQALSAVVTVPAVDAVTDPDPVSTPGNAPRTSQSRGKVRTRRLPDYWRTKWPDAQSVLITNKDGTQVLFVP